MPAKRHEYYHDPVLTYVDATVRTATRSREILILIIIVSVLIFGSFWNSRRHSWINDRIAIHAKALELKDLEAEVKALENDNLTRVQKERELSAPEYQRAREFLKARPHLGERQAVVNALARLQNIVTENVWYLKLPFFGIVIDINDLGMLGGFTFVVLLLWFRSSLWHEAQNLHVTFQVANSQEDPRYYYEVLSMQQVLTTPPSVAGVPRSTDHWSIIVRVLMLLPAVVQGVVFWHDGASFDLGWTISPGNTVIAMTVSALFLAIIVILTVVCFRLLNRIVGEWRDSAAFISGKIAKRGSRPQTAG